MKRHMTPADARRLILLDASDRSSFEDQLAPFQRRDCDALDKRVVGLVCGVQRTDGEPLPGRHTWIERPRGHSKTTDIAFYTAYLLWATPSPISGVIAAVDRDQARLLVKAVGKLCRCNPLFSALRVSEDKIVNTRTGSHAIVLSSDVASSWGLLVDFIICDEMCHWPKPDLWNSLFSTAAKRRSCWLAVLSNAGLRGSWQWELREKVRQSSDWYFRALKRPSAPWIDRASLELQKQLLPDALYRRLWLNEWVDASGSFFSEGLLDGCVDPDLEIAEWGEPGIRYFAAIDYGEIHDRTAAAIVHWDDQSHRFIVDRLDVSVPTRDRPVPTRWLEEWIAWAMSRFPLAAIVADPHQLVGMIQRYETTCPIERFSFRAGRGNQELANVLLRSVRESQLAFYEDCGRVATSDDLLSELKALNFRQTTAGNYRFDHSTDGHDDRAFVVSAAIHRTIHDTGEDWMVNSGNILSHH